MRAILATLALTLATPALADEAWSTPFGDAIYESEVGDTTVLTVPSYEGTMRVYLPGLAGNYDNRDTHFGYWIGNGPETCAPSMEAVDGVRSKQWGRVVLVFDKPAYPTGWTLVYGTCFQPPVNGIHGDAY